MDDYNAKLDGEKSYELAIETKRKRGDVYYLKDARPTVNSDGGPTDYYKLPDGATELNDLIEHKNMPYALGNIFKACYRFGNKDVASKLYDVNKILYFAERMKRQIENED